MKRTKIKVVKQLVIDRDPPSVPGVGIHAVGDRCVLAQPLDLHLGPREDAVPMMGCFEFAQELRCKLLPSLRDGLVPARWIVCRNVRWDVRWNVRWNDPCLTAVFRSWAAASAESWIHEADVDGPARVDRQGNAAAISIAALARLPMRSPRHSKSERVRTRNELVLHGTRRSLSRAPRVAEALSSRTATSAIQALPSIQSNIRSDIRSNVRYLKVQASVVLSFGSCLSSDMQSQDNLVRLVVFHLW